jgi:hypothetical protein
MNSTFDDPYLTAYVLDELDKDGRDLIEDEMRRRKEFRFEARELADFADQLRAALATEPMPELTPGHKRAITATLQQTGSRRKPFWVPITANWMLRAELALLVALVLWFVPIPASLLVPMNRLFAGASVHTARAMLRAVGTRVEWSDSILILPAPVLRVPPGFTPPGYKPPSNTITIDFRTWICNLRFWNTLLLTTGFLLGNLYLRSTWRKLTLIALAIPLVILSDAVRKFVLAEWLLHTNGQPFQLPVFNLTQPVFILFSFLALLPFLIWFRRTEKMKWSADCGLRNAESLPPTPRK